MKTFTRRKGTQAQVPARPDPPSCARRDSFDKENQAPGRSIAASRPVLPPRQVLGRAAESALNRVTAADVLTERPSNLFNFECYSSDPESPEKPTAAAPGVPKVLERKPVTFTAQLSGHAGPRGGHGQNQVTGPSEASELAPWLVDDGEVPEHIPLKQNVLTLCQESNAPAAQNPSRVKRFSKACANKGSQPIPLLVKKFAHVNDRLLVEMPGNFDCLGDAGVIGRLDLGLDSQASTILLDVKGERREGTCRECATTVLLVNLKADGKQDGSATVEAMFPTYIHTAPLDPDGAGPPHSGPEISAESNEWSSSGIVHARAACGKGPKRKRNQVSRVPVQKITTAKAHKRKRKAGA